MKHKTCMLEDIIRYFDLYYCHLYIVCYFVKANKSFGTLCWDKTTQDGPETVLDFSSLGGRRWKHMLLGKMTCCAKSIWHELKTPKSAMFAWVWCGISVFQMVLRFPHGINGLGAQAFTKLGRKKKALWHQTPSHLCFSFFTKGNVFGRLFISN